MNAIQHVYEPNRLLLVWHSPDTSKISRRRVVGELIKDGEDAIFRYIKDTSDFEEALQEGFFEFPAFSQKNSPHTGALDVFLRRIPPRKRADFKEYLSQYSLPADFNGSAFSLLGYTGARLPSDTFELCPDLSDAEAPLDLVIEVSGVKHHLDISQSINEGDTVTFEIDQSNPYDSNAIKVIHHGKQVGFVNKAISSSFRGLMHKGQLIGSVLKYYTFRSKPGIMLLVRYR